MIFFINVNVPGQIYSQSKFHFILFCLLHWSCYVINKGLTAPILNMNRTSKLFNLIPVFLNKWLGRLCVKALIGAYTIFLFSEQILNFTFQSFFE